MTNEEIEKHKKNFAEIKNKVNKAEDADLKKWLINVVEGIREAQKLADDVCATKYLGTDLEKIEDFIARLKVNTANLSYFSDRLKIGETIFNEICRNIYYALQTEEMFNACVFAKRSCFWAAVAATVACISVILTACLN